MANARPLPLHCAIGCPVEADIAERLSAACVGREEDCFRKALVPVSESLVSA